MAEKITILVISLMLWILACGGFYSAKAGAGDVAVLYQAAASIDYTLPTPQRVAQENRLMLLTGAPHPDPYEAIPVQEPVEWQFIR